MYTTSTSMNGPIIALKTFATPATTYSPSISTVATIDHEANNYALYILTSLLCLFVIITILITIVVVCQFKNCKKVKEQTRLTPASDSMPGPNTMDPIYETISLTSNQFAQPPVPPIRIRMSENDAYYPKVPGQQNKTAVTMSENDAYCPNVPGQQNKTAITMSENDAYYSEDLSLPVKLAAIAMSENNAYCSEGLGQKVKAAIKMCENDAYCFEDHRNRGKAALVTNSRSETQQSTDEGIEPSTVEVVANEAYLPTLSIKMTNNYPTCEYGAHQRAHSWCHGCPTSHLTAARLQKPFSVQSLDYLSNKLNKNTTKAV